MNMKKICIILAALAALVSCTQEVEDYTPDYSGRLAIYPTSMAFSQDLDTSYIDVGSNTNWTVSSNAGWCKVEKISSNKARVIALQKDLYLPSREAVITVSTLGGETVRYVNISQLNDRVPEVLGTWTVTEDANLSSTWYNGETYTITITRDETDKTKVWIKGFCPYFGGEDPVIYGFINSMDFTLSIPYQSFQESAWYEPGVAICIAPLVSGTFADNVGLGFTNLPINNTGSNLTINLLGGFGTYSYMMGAADGSTGEFLGAYGYCRNTVWVKD